MRSFDELGGLYAILLGVVVLVFAGIGVSLVFDNQISLDRAESDMQRIIDRQEETILDLEGDIKDARRRWREDYAPRLDQADRTATLRRELDVITSRRELLSERRSDLAAAIPELEEQTSDYVSRLRTRARSRLVGRSFDRFELRDGREYADVRIRGVDDHGIRISHATGIARLAFADFTDKWREKVHWRPDEQGTGNETPPSSPETPPRTMERERERERQRAVTDKLAEQEEQTAHLDRLRRRLRATRQRYISLRQSAREARSRANRGDQRSVPGSLETWAERAERLDQRRQRVYLRYREYFADLAEIAPGDRLLDDPLEP